MDSYDNDFLFIDDDLFLLCVSLEELLKSNPELVKTLVENDVEEVQ